MNCVHVQTSLAEDLLNRTDAEVAAHLASCPECRKLCDELLELEDLSRSLSGQFRVPTEFRDEVLERLDDRRDRRRRRFGFAAAILVIGLVVAAFVRPWESHSAGDPSASNSPAVMHFDGSAEAPAAEPGYVDVVVTRDGSDELILRVPSVIEIRQPQIQEDFFINNVSH